MAKQKYILWDFDGTLGHRTGMWSGTLLEVLQAHGMAGSLTVEVLRPFLTTGFRWHRTDITYPAATPTDQWWRELEPLFERAFREAAGLSQQDARRLAQEVRGTYTHPVRWQLFPDTLPALSALTAKGWRHVMLSNHVPELRQILQSLKIDTHFDAVFNSAETGIEKPHREAFESVRRTLPAAAQLWMIGDSMTADVQGAEAAGIPAILVRKPQGSMKRFAENLWDVSAFLEDPSPPPIVRTFN